MGGSGGTQDPQEQKDETSFGGSCAVLRICADALDEDEYANISHMLVNDLFPNWACPRRVLTQHLKGGWLALALGGSPARGQQVPPASGAWFPQPQMLVLKVPS